MPGGQVGGYLDPHTGTRFHVPAVFVGNEQTATLERAAREGRFACIVVRATWDRARTRNLMATLRGQSRQRIVVNTHTDGVTWVFTSDGTFAYGRQLDRDYDGGTVAVPAGDLQTAAALIDRSVQATNEAIAQLQAAGVLKQTTIGKRVSPVEMPLLQGSAHLVEGGRTQRAGRPRSRSRVSCIRPPPPRVESARLRWADRCAALWFEPGELLRSDFPVAALLGALHTVEHARRAAGEGRRAEVLARMLA